MPLPRISLTAAKFDMDDCRSHYDGQANACNRLQQRIRNRFVTRMHCIAFLMVACDFVNPSRTTKVPLRCRPHLTATMAAATRILAPGKCSGTTERGSRGGRNTVGSRKQRQSGLGATTEVQVPARAQTRRHQPNATQEGSPGRKCPGGELLK